MKADLSIKPTDYTKKELAKIANVYWEKYTIFRRFMMVHNWNLYEGMENATYSELKEILAKLNKELESCQRKRKKTN